MDVGNKQPNFQRRREVFICENCGAAVKGNGYTNHCPVCLWSKHVDINPGDRLSDCGGMMEPIGIEMKSQKYIIVHRCIKCGFKKKNKVSPGDDFGALLSLS
jgi:hypothetical protein